jgi:excisionase family DNA binding protein
MQLNRSQLLTVPQLAKELNCSRRHVINLTNKRLIPHIRLGRCVRYNVDAVQRALTKLEVREIS